MATKWKVICSKKDINTTYGTKKEADDTAAIHNAKNSGHVATVTKIIEN